MRISILAPDGGLGAEVFGIADVLRIANALATGMGGSPPFEISLVCVREGGVDLAGGARLIIGRPRRCDLLVVPAFDVTGIVDFTPALARLAPEVEFLKALGRDTAVASICGGAFLLGEAGLLEGRHCTTAWAFAAELARRNPTARVEASHMIVRDGPVTTCGAFSAGQDLALELIRQHASESLARTVGRFTLLDAGRDSQAPYLDLRQSDAALGSFAGLISQWLELRLGKPYNLRELAAAFNVSDRTLLRRFKQETGQSPLKHLQQLRLVQASRLLETTRLSIAEIAELVGYLDLPTFSRLFSRTLSVTPAAYRRKFRRKDGAI